ncbi:MAG: hypothetical protein N3A58_02930 [Spirochaetes bacterium]|nr:hypothetical protein [Spirochaetota bacterium]
MKKVRLKIFYLFILILFLSILSLNLYSAEEDYFILFDSPFQIRGGYFYSFTTFDIKNSLPNKIYENIYYSYYLSFTFNLNYLLNFISKTLNKGEFNTDSGTIYAGINLFYDNFNLDPYGATIRLIYLNKIIFLSFNIDFLTRNFNNYFNGLNINLKLDLYPYFFIGTNFYSSFYPIKLMNFYEENLNLEIFERTNSKFEVGIYIYQNELSFIYSNFSSAFYQDNLTYYKIGIKKFILSLRMIPTYSFLGYKISAGVIVNSLNQYLNGSPTSIDNLYYYNFYFNGGIIYKPIKNIYIIVVGGYKPYYFPKPGVLFDTNLKQIIFECEILINF